MKDLHDATVAITGASSGIGRATALAFAREGANLALIARQGDALDRLARACRRLGGRAVAVPADVGDAAAMHHAARVAARFTGRLDVWVNNAGVGAVGEFTRTPAEAHDRVILTNLLGTLHGAHAALPYFQGRGKGILINVISFGGWVPAPFAAAYTASKFGLRGLSESLRSEVSGTPGIRVCDVFPSFVDTPGIQHGANYTGKHLQQGFPATPPEAVARAIVGLAHRPRNAVTVGAVATVARLGYTLLPGASRAAMRLFMGAALRRASPDRGSSGNLFRPARTGPRGGEAARGGWQHRDRRLAVPVMTALGLAGVAALGGTVLLQRSR